MQVVYSPSEDKFYLEENGVLFDVVENQNDAFILRVVLSKKAVYLVGEL